jgi:pyruvate dehydrogenase E1 component alpha subunit
MARRTIAEFSVSQLQILDEQGQIDEELDPKLEPERLLRLYRAMVLAREVDGRMLKLQRQGRLGTFPPCTGQEAAVCGAALGMGERDWLVGSYRELGARLMRGEPLLNYLLYYCGYEEGNTTAAGLRILPVTVVLASQLPHAVGIAYAMRQRAEGETAVVAFFGDGASSQGDFHEALNFAGVWKVPVVFICQNNGWAISVPRGTQTAAQTLAQKAISYGFDGIQVDGNDALAMFVATRDALARARAGGGPTLIEAVTYRLLMHTTADDPKKYRSPEEEQQWWQRDPLRRMRSYLEGRGLWDEPRQAKLEEELRTEVDGAVKAMEAFRAGRPDAPFDHVFGTSHPSVEAARRRFLAEQAEQAQPGSAPAEGPAGASKSESATARTGRGATHG